MSWDDEELGKAIDLIARRIGSALKKDEYGVSSTQTIYLDPGATDTLSNRFDRIAGSLEDMVENQNKIGSLMLESSAILALQKENATLHAALSAADRRTRALMQYIQDLSSPCIGCKKQVGQAHTAGCGWEVSIDLVLKTPEVTNGSQVQEEHNAE